MAYTVLARKYRSATFDEVIGQEPIATTLANAIKAGRIHHGYLFTGTRGVGKTSMARILAKSLNCVTAKGPTVKPCCKCEACIAIAEGQDMDVVEIDAASNTGVDNIRELRANTAYRPARCRFKIYIIDEVHMLSTGAFNALLKTLEEPPDHVKFILATTETQKVPATVQSRCQKFNFRNISPDDIAARLEQIVKDEGAKSDKEVVRRIARLANGSMRDALSILDQLLSVSPKKLSPEILNEVLPPAENERIVKLLSHAASGEVGATLVAADQILATGRGLEVFCNDVIEVARTLMLVRACGADTDLADFPAGDRDEYAELADRFELSQYVQMIAMIEELRRNVRFSAAGRALVDAVIVRLANMRQWSSIEDLLGQAGGGAGTKKNAPLGNVAPAARSRSAGPPSPAKAAPPPPSVAQPPPAVHAAQPPVRDSHRAPSSEPLVPESLLAPTQDAPPPPTVHSAPRNEVEPVPRPEPMADPSEAAPTDPRRPRRRPLSSEERAEVDKSPVVREVLDLFDGVIVEAVQELEHTPPGDDAAELDDSESEP
jgi:DNA polymerase-3 subunit gamma/tau